MNSTAQDLDENQKIALDLFQAGRSVALVGGGGTGKSHVLKMMIALAEQKVGTFPFVAPCALSNRAAESINGVTIHKLFGAKPSWEFSKEYLLQGLRSKPHLCNLLRKIQILIIDEISFLTSNVIDAIDYVLRHFSASEWHSSLPLGGRQLVLSGDPYQLEPYEECGYVQKDTLRTAFQSRTWYLNFGAPGDGVVINLKSNHRQSTDPSFFSMLNRIRVGIQTDSDIQSLNSLCNCTIGPPVGHTRLCLTNEQVAKINAKKLKQLPEPFFRMKAVDTFFSADRSNVERKLDGVAPRIITLKQGAHVIITRKVQHNDCIIPPGAQGIVRRVEGSGSHFNGTKPTVMVEISDDLSLQRRTESSGLRQTSGALVRVTAASFEIHRFDRSVVAKREQLPLIPAYAITIHRSQGLTLTRVAIDFQVACNWKPHGMAYVALSRCESSQGLWVKGLKNSHVSISERAKDVMRELWKLHVHMPSRIWGVSTPSCLNLSNEDIAEEFPTIGRVNSSDDSTIQNFEGKDCPENLVSMSAAQHRSRCGVHCIFANESLSYRAEVSDTLSNFEKRNKRVIDLVRTDNDDDSDVEVLFVGVVKKMRRTR